MGFIYTKYLILVIFIVSSSLLFVQCGAEDNLSKQVSLEKKARRLWKEGKLATTGPSSSMAVLIPEKKNWWGKVASPSGYVLKSYSADGNYHLLLKGSNNRKLHCIFSSKHPEVLELVKGDYIGPRDRLRGIVKGVGNGNPILNGCYFANK